MERNTAPQVSEELEKRIQEGKALTDQLEDGWGLTTTDLSELAAKHNNNMINASFDLYRIAFRDGVAWARSHEV